MKRLSACILVFSTLVACSAGEKARTGGGAVQDEAAIEALLSRMTAAWGEKSGALFAQDFSDDAVFTVWFGFQMVGPEEIAQGHQIIFDGIYANTDALFAADKIRFLDDDTALVHIRGYLFENGAAPADGPPGFVPLMVAQRGATGWKIEAFQNTKLDISNMKGGKDIREDGDQ